MSGLDPEIVEHALNTARQRGFRQVALRLGDDSFRAVLGDGVEEESHEPFDELELGDLPGEPVVKESVVPSPAVGYFRATNTTVSPGDAIEAGDKIGEIISLGMSNDVTAASGGEVVEILVADGDAVEYGQTLVRLVTK